MSFLGLIGLSVAQNSADIKPRKRGEIYFSWGYNRDWYSKSDIHVFRNDPDPSKSYDFMLFDATAHDKPDFWRYWYLDRLTIPQYDMTFGYFLGNKKDIGFEISWNHLKYVVTDWQNVHMKGQIHGTPIDRVAPLDPDTLHLQHTNGNNYLLFNVVKRQNLINYHNIQLSAIGKVGAGPLISYTIDTILGDNDPGYFHYHGWVAAVGIGVRATFLKYAFIQTDMQGAFANYTNTKIGHEHLGNVRHHFYSLQWTWEAGFLIPVGKR
ncbi:membrane protein [Cytophagales bacterium WSM2-2]|nr:membrane protein [Cytophagales bacterium WSM2-2]